MTAITLGTDYFISESLPNAGTKMLVVSCIDSVDTDDTLEIDLSAYGIGDNGFIGVLGFTHTTENSVMVAEQPTTAVASGVLTLTIGGTGATDPS